MKLKDLFTLGNLLSGYGSVIALFTIEDPYRAFEWGCYLIYIGYVFDVLDGPVARLTKQHDTFGGIFDSLCDFVTNSIAPAFLLFFAYWKLGDFHWLLAAGVGAFPIALGTLRQAKQQDRPLTYPCYWIGVPRPVLTIFILALLNSSAFTLLAGWEIPWGDTGYMVKMAGAASPWREIGYGVVALFVVVGSFLHLSKLPFVNHHERRWMMFLRFGKHMFRSVALPVLLVGWLVLDWPGIIYDYFLFCLINYLALSWTQLTREDLRRYRAYVNGGDLVKPLVHRDDTWQPKTLCPLYLEHDAGR